MSQVEEVTALMKVLGDRLRAARLERNDTMAIFAQRLAVSERTVRAMERGEPTVQIGTWMEALWILDRLDEMQPVIAPKESLLDRVRRQRPSRRRASKRKR